ncbi:MAG: IPT/TIG domain-containing protein [Acidobacteriaceae bacterium]
MPRADGKIDWGGIPWSRSGFLQLLLFAACLLLGAGAAQASGPRWVTGPPYFTGTSGNPVTWYTTNPLYFTDPGDLSAYVNHAAANALVAAAANLWNVPTAAMTIAYGGPLAEHVSGTNAYLGSNGPVFPADVQSSNYAAMQIAVIYDSDGSVTDMLLGGGASSPAECRQNAVTESVDSITPAGSILHAILVLNGRCTGPAPEQQLQMQYQLQRAFGRVLGLGWSQTNDNVFTGTPQATYNQAMHWPILHPIDIICGPYAYLCLPQPFTLRDDDVAAISGLYPYIIFYNPTAPPPAPGKIWTYSQASVVYGTMSFPSGQGMQGVNVVLQRQQGGWGIPEAWYDVSAVSGYEYQQNAGNPVTGAASGLSESLGSTNGQKEGSYNLAWVPDIDPPGAQNGGMFVVVTTEAINPLYIGAYSVGPYSSGNVEPSGASMSQLLDRYPASPYMYPSSSVQGNFAPSDAAANCNTSGDGVESEPLPVASGGWWTGVLCEHGHTAWSSFNAKAGRTATLEVTALDEVGLATTAKAMPLIGAWNASDPTGTLPTLAATPSAFNTVTLGMTAAGVATTQAEGLRFVIADARGDGRPDFAYQARVLYADTVQPTSTSVNGGQIVIGGMGFRAGNQVRVNGVVATLSSWSATSIVAVAPPQSAFSSNPAGPVDIEVDDLSTGATSVMSGALTYGGVAPDQMKLVTAPSGSVQVGTIAAVPFAVRVLLSDGVTPVVGMPVTFTVSGATVQFGACNTGTCVLLTDATGLASTTLTPEAFGTVTIQAAAAGVTQSATFLALARSIAMAQTDEFIAAGATVAWIPQSIVAQNGAPAVGTAVAWTASGGMLVSPASSLVNSQGVAQAAAIAGPLAAGAQATGQACVWTTLCANFAAAAVAPSAWQLTVIGGAGQTVPVAGTFAPVVLIVTDASGDPVAGAPLAVYQTVNPIAMPCPARGRCPVAPMLASSVAEAVSDANGLVSVVPMQLAGMAEATNVAAATGTQGFASLSLQQGP